MFSSYHPAVCFCFFAAVMTITMFALHPLFSAISLLGAALCAVLRKRGKFLLAFIPMAVFTALLNPLFNHRGVTTLFLLWDGNPVTLESMIYGLCAGLMLLAALTWFSYFNAVMTSDKLIPLFAGTIPALSLMFSMTLRFIPLFKNRFSQVYSAAKANGEFSSKRLVDRLRSFSSIVSIVITWSLESAADTADGMSARGYGTGRRSSFTPLSFTPKDTAALVFILLLSATSASGAFFGSVYASFYPSITFSGFTSLSFISFSAQALLCFFPVLVNALEDVKWKSKSKT